MDKRNKLEQSCWGATVETTSMVDKKAKCPKCYQMGKKVASITVDYMVSEAFSEKIADEETYYLCMSEDCNVAYYRASDGKVFYKEEVRLPIWFKKDANPKYICYCNQVTEEEIISGVLNHGAKNMKDIIKLTGAMKNGKCETKNPLGKCCGPLIQEIINETLIG